MIFKKGALIFLLSIILQSIFMFSYRNLSPIQGDGREYQVLALNLLEKHAYVGYISDDDANVRRPPGYPVFIAFIYKLFGNKIINLQIAQMILIGISCVLVYLLGIKISAETLAFWAGFFSAVNTIMIPLSYYIMSESLMIFFVTLILYLTISLIRNVNLLGSIICGVVLGLATLIRPIVMFLPLVIICLIYYLTKCRLKFLAAIILPFLLIVSSWTIRNYRVSGYFIPISLGGEMELWNGSFLPGQGYSDHPETNKKRQELYQEFRSIIGRDKFNKDFNYIIEWKMFQKEAIGNITQNPFAYISLIPLKILRLYIGSYSSLYGIDTHFSDLFCLKCVTDRVQLSKLFFKIISLMNSVLILLLLIVGIITNFRNKLVFPVMAIWLYWTAIHVLFSPIPRYSIPILPVMILLMVFGITGLDRKKSVFLNKTGGLA